MKDADKVSQSDEMAHRHHDVDPVGGQPAVPDCPLPCRDAAQAPPADRHIAQFDGLRGVLALWVVAAHILSFCGYADVALPPPFSLAWAVFVDAVTAVDVFIILSGFVITFQLRERQPSYLRFMAGRIFRIYPVYLVCLTIGIAVASFAPTVVGGAAWENTAFLQWFGGAWAEEQNRMGPHVVAHLTLLFGLIPAAVLPQATATLLAPAWSLSLEWQYYLFAPLIAKMFCGGKGLMVLALVSWLGIRYGHLWQNPHLAFLPAQLPLFIVGIASYHFFAYYRDKAAINGAVSTLPSGALLAVGLVVPWHSVALTIWAVGFGSVFARGNDGFAMLLRAVRSTLCHSVLQRLGRLSYPLYLVHWPLLILLQHVLISWWPNVSSSQALVVMFCCGLPVILLVSQILHQVVEAPGMAMGRRWTRARRGLVTS